MNERTFHANHAQRLDDPERLRWLPPGDVIAELPLQAGSVIADVGAGTGYFSLPLGRAVGQGGKVFAVDFQKEMLSHIKEKLTGPDAPSNVVLVEGEATRTHLAEGGCDLVFMANLWHELDDHPAVLQEASRILRRDGSLVIVDWKADHPSPPGPPVEHRISVEQAEATLAGNDWAVKKSRGVGRHSYLILASPTRQQLISPSA